MEEWISDAHPLADFTVSHGNVVVDWNQNGPRQRLTLAGNVTLSFVGQRSGIEYLLLLKQDATGSRTVTWPSGTLKPGGTLTLTTTARKQDVIACLWDDAAKVWIVFAKAQNL